MPYMRGFKRGPDWEASMLMVAEAAKLEAPARTNHPTEIKRLRLGNIAYGWTFVSATKTKLNATCLRALASARRLELLTTKKQGTCCYPARRRPRRNLGYAFSRTSATPHVHPTSR